MVKQTYGLSGFGRAHAAEAESVPGEPRLVEVIEAARSDWRSIGEGNGTDIHANGRKESDAPTRVS